MAAQVGKTAVIVERRSLLQAAEHAHKATRVITGFGQHAVADAVGLALHVTRIAQLLLQGRGLAADHQGLCPLRTAGCRQRAQDHRADHQRRHAGLVVNRTGNVPLSDVAELVRQHRGQLIVRAHRGNQSQMHAQIAAGQGKGIDGAVTPDHDAPGKALAQLGAHFTAPLSRLYQRVPQTVQVFVEHRVFEVIGVAVELACDAVAQLSLGAQRQALGMAEGGQGGSLRPGGTRPNQQGCAQGQYCRAQGRMRWVHGQAGTQHPRMMRQSCQAFVKARSRALFPMSKPDSPLTHFDAQGQAHMVDVGAKASTHRTAVAHGRIRMQPATLALIQSGTAKKGDVLGIARLAGIMGAKRTSDLIPLCHPIALTRVTVDFKVLPEDSTVVCTATAETVGQTGVEMEALTAVQVALLTIYDMCKAVDRGMTITDVKLLEKHGGKSGSWVAAQ